MYNAYADIAKNRLYIELSGFMMDGEVAAAADMCIAEGKKLHKGFDIINDISTFKPATPAGADEIKRAQMALGEMGVGHVIRVVGASSIATMQFNRTQNAAGYVADTTATKADAEKMLENLRAGVR